MFDFAWSEIVLIGAVALIAIGPKDMPAAIRTVSSMIKKARRMAAEFQTHVDEMVREADLGDMKKTFNDIRNFDVHSLVEKTVDPDRSLRNTFASNPLEPQLQPTYPTVDEVATLEPVTVTTPPVPEAVPLADNSLPDAALAAAVPAKPAAPAWIPPDQIPPPVIKAAVTPAAPPAWIPPNAVPHRHAPPARLDQP